MIRSIKIILLFLPVFLSCNNNNDKVENNINEKVDSLDTQTTWDYNPANGWQTISLKDAGLDSLVLDSLHKAVLAHQKNSEDYRSILIIKGNYLAFEKYYDGGGESELNSIKSVTKNITALLVGKAIELGLIESVDQKISDFFPDYFNDVDDSLKKEITIEHLLTMSAGFKWNNFGGKYRSGWDLYKGNRHEYMITQTVMENKPGEIFNYNSGLSHMLSGIITNESGMKTEEFAKKYLFDSLGIDNYKWTADRNGYNLGNSELFLTSRDMAKIGLLVLRKGFWYDNQLIQKEWIEEMLEPKIETAGIGEKYSQYYGYQWWHRKFNELEIYFAAGYGGQYIFVVPELDITAVFTTNWSRSTVSFDPLKHLESFAESLLND